MKKIFNIFFVLFIALILAATVRGNVGNPNDQTINDLEWTELGPLELSPERGRFALTYSLIEDNSLEFSLPIARFSLPDLGYKDGKYVSLFAPGVSFLTIPGYLAGKIFNVSQLGTYLVISVFALLNVLLIRSIAKKLGVKEVPAVLAALIFLFATPAFSYAVSLFQHHISTFLILASIYSILSLDYLKAFAITSFLFGVGIAVDYPNGFIMAPIIVYLVSRIFYQKKENHSTKYSISIGKLIAVLTIIPTLIFFFWFNKTSYGSFFTLSGTVENAREINDAGDPIFPVPEQTESEETLSYSVPQNSAFGFFLTRNMINGLYVNFISPDRGILIFTPIILIGLLGFSVLYKKNKQIFALFISIVGLNILLYSMWGDPWGGWAFGARYLVPSYAILAIFISLVFANMKREVFKVIAIYLLLIYSIFVSTLGAVTSSRNPPKIEAQNLSIESGKEEKYTIERNIDLLFVNKSKSFVFNEFADNFISAWNYFILITLMLMSASTLLYFYIVLQSKEKLDSNQDFSQIFNFFKKGLNN